MLEWFIAGLLLFPAATLVAQVPQSKALPQPAATPTDFPFIGRTRSKRFCSLETERINGGITVVLTNDKLIAAGIGHLRGADLDRPELTIIEREKTMHDLRYIASAIQTNLKAGDAEIADVRGLSVKEPDGLGSIDQRAAHDPLDSLFNSVADDFADRAVLIGKSEDAASVHVPKAVAGC